MALLFSHVSSLPDHLPHKLRAGTQAIVACFNGRGADMPKGESHCGKSQHRQSSMSATIGSDVAMFSSHPWGSCHE
jgi:hypothetical protein